MPPIRLELCGEAEIIVPADEFEPFTQLDQAEKLLRKKDLCGDPSFDDRLPAVVIHSEGQAFVVALRDRIEQLGTIAGAHRHPALPPGPASLVVVKNAKPHKAVQQVEAARREQAGDAIEVVEEFAVGPYVERTEQHINEIERAETAVEVAHIPQDKRGLDTETARLVAGELDHCGAQVEPAISVAPPVPFLQIRCGAGA